METTRIETADVEALEHRVREIRHGLITFDGCMLAGKTGLMREIARRLRVTPEAVNPKRSAKSTRRSFAFGARSR